MRVYNMPAKKYEEGEVNLLPHHFIVFDDHEEMEASNTDHDWMVYENYEIKTGRMTVAKVKLMSEFMFRSDGMTPEEIIEKILDVYELKRRKHDTVKELRKKY
jgi:hypothetical protein